MRDRVARSLPRGIRYAPRCENRRINCGSLWTTVYPYLVAGDATINLNQQGLEILLGIASESDLRARFCDFTREALFIVRIRRIAVHAQSAMQINYVRSIKYRLPR